MRCVFGLVLGPVATSALELLQPLDGDEPGLAAYHQMSDGAGTIVTDDSLNSWDGTLNDGLPPQVLPDGPIEWVESGALQLPEASASLVGDTVVLQIEDVSLVDLASFTARASGDAAVLSWLTYSEYYNRGFNIYRANAADGQYELISGEMIQSSGGDSEASYQFTDQPGDGTYYYVLEDVNDQGVTTRHEAAVVTIGDVPGSDPSLFLPSLQR